MNPLGHNKNNTRKSWEMVFSFLIHTSPSDRHSFTPKRRGGRELVAQVLHVRFQKRTDLVGEMRQVPKFCLPGNPPWDSSPHGKGRPRLPWAARGMEEAARLLSEERGAGSLRAVRFLTPGPVAASPMARLPRLKKWSPRP